MSAFVSLAVVNKCTLHYIKTTDYFATQWEEHFYGRSVAGKARLQSQHIAKTSTGILFLIYIGFDNIFIPSDEIIKKDG